MKKTKNNKENININNIPINAHSSDLSESEQSLDDSSLNGNKEYKDEEKENSIISNIPKFQKGSFDFFDEKSLEDEDFINFIKDLDNPKKKKEEEKNIFNINSSKTDSTTKTKNKEQVFIERKKEQSFLNKKRKEK